MVWFQCEDCGENLKKPKLPNHFRICSANKLSCIDCGQTFGQQSVQGHTQCITEAEKYGPKGQVKTANAATSKGKNDLKQKPNIDINVGLSERPPWFCSLCNTQATSQQTLLLHAEGKKHRAKARAFHAARQPPKQTVESTPSSKVSTERTPKDELPGNKDVVEPEKQDQPRAALASNISEAENGSLPLTKKRKHNASETGAPKMKVEGSSGELGNGEVIQGERAEAAKTKYQLKKAKQSVPDEDERLESGSTLEDTKNKIKWKKLITSVLKANPKGVLKMKKLKKLVLKALRDSDITEDESQLINVLEHKVNSSSRFSVNGKYVHLVAKS
ncbi:UBP1-associated proteins 1C [Cornus florida]|uniref:UBP1-associated proteins 1C n=1 Tax=Cornus florida TaxID=4283 RepID=UPI00289E84FD|nr:UBP1-associated proteins 1C [Cornus florida]